MKSDDYKSTKNKVEYLDDIINANRQRNNNNKSFFRTKRN